MSPDDIMLSEISQLQKKNVLFHLYELPRVVRIIGIGNRMLVAKVWGEEVMRSYCLMCTESQYCKMKEFWRQMVVMGAQ